MDEILEKFSDNEEEYMVKKLLELMKLKTEDEVLEYISEEIELLQPKVDVFGDACEYGVYAVMPSANVPKRTVIFDAHVDSECDEGNDSFFGCSEWNVEGTDQNLMYGNHVDRVNCALLLTMVKFVRLEFTSFVALFSRGRKDKFSGVKKFSEIKLEEVHNLDKMIVQVVILGVTDARNPWEEERNGIDYSESMFSTTIGKGIVPMSQNWRYNPESTSNRQGFLEGARYHLRQKTCYMIGCAMEGAKVHTISLSDLFELYDWIKRNYNLTIPNIPSSSLKPKGIFSDNYVHVRELYKLKIDKQIIENARKCCRKKVINMKRDPEEEEKYLENILKRILKIKGTSTKENPILDFICQEVLSIIDDEEEQEQEQEQKQEIEGEEEEEEEEEDKHKGGQGGLLEGPYISRLGGHGFVEMVRDPGCPPERDSEFGLLVFIPSYEEEKEVLLFDAHCDTVIPNENYENYENYVSKYFKCETKQVQGKKKRIWTGPTFDDRSMCSILLTMIKYHRFKHVSAFYLFSTMEEIGLRGAFMFSELFSINKRYDCKLNNFIILDVTWGKLEDDDTSINYPIIGAGFCPIEQQWRSNFGKDRMKTKAKGRCEDDPLMSTNGQAFQDGEYGVIPRTPYSIPCDNMHDPNEIISFDDLKNLYLFLCSEKFLIHQKENRIYI